MAAEWHEVAVAQIAAISPNALVTGPFGSSISSRFFQSHGVPVIRGSNLTDTVGERLRDDGLVFLSPEKAAEFSRSVARQGDLVFTCWGTIGQVGLIDRRARYAEYIISNKQMKLTPDSARFDSLFLYYLFSSPAVSEEIKNQSIGSSVPGFNLGQLKAVRLRLPSIDAQRAIAQILGALDDKIELNRKMNETLEAMARALFKSWFVDFDPVRAKAEGRAPSGMDAETAKLFPSEFVESELGPIPKGWLSTRWGAIASLEYGKGLKGYEAAEGKVPVWGTNGRIGWHTAALCPHAGIIVGRKGAYRGIHYCPTPFFVIDTAFFMRSTQDLSWRWAFYELRRNDLNAMDSGSAIPSTSREEFYQIPVCVPPLLLQRRFEDALSVAWEYQEENRTQSATLVRLRDELLPRLLSGELDSRSSHE